MTTAPRVMVDMSVTLLHNGHIRLLKAAKAMGTVIVALTTDVEVEGRKGYTPELDYAAREEILLALRYVDEVVPSPWLIDVAFLDRHRIDFLVHGDDNSNDIPIERLRVLPRTPGISSTLLRTRALRTTYQLIERDNAEQ